MAIVTYGRPVSEYFPKLTLLETMGIIVACKYDCDYRGEARSKASRRVGQEVDGGIYYNGFISRSAGVPRKSHLASPVVAAPRLMNDKRKGEQRSLVTG